MSFLKEMFKTEKPIIGLLHLKPLPGDPFYAPGGSMEDVIACARADLDALQKGGVDGVLVTNELSLPYEKKVSGVTLGAMGMVVGALREQFRVPFGVEAIYDGDATMELCAATEADFTRCLFTGAWAGDLGLVDRDVAKTLRHQFRKDDIIARLGGDEFVILLKNLDSDAVIERLAASLNRALCRTYTQDNISLSISASIGIARAPIDGTTSAELYPKADAALYEVKRSGKGSFHIYQPPSQ